MESLASLKNKVKASIASTASGYVSGFVGAIRNRIEEYFLEDKFVAEVASRVIDGIRQSGSAYINEEKIEMDIERVIKERQYSMNLGFNRANIEALSNCILKKYFALISDEKVENEGIPEELDQNGNRQTSFDDLIRDSIKIVSTINHIKRQARSAGCDTAILYVVERNLYTDIPILLDYDHCDARDPIRGGEWAGWSLLGCAVYMRHSEMVRFLLKQKVNPNQPMPNGKWKGWSLLAYSVYQGYDEIVECLLKDQRVDPNQTMPNRWWKDWSLLAYSVYQGYDKIVECLLKDQRVDPNQTMPNWLWKGQSLLVYSNCKGYNNIEKCLKNAGAALRHPFNFNERENAMNLSSQAEIQAYAQKQGTPLIMPDMRKPSVIHGHESQKFQKNLETKAKNEGMPESTATEEKLESEDSVSVATQARLAALTKEKQKQQQQSRKQREHERKQERGRKFSLLAYSEDWSLTPYADYKKQGNTAKLLQGRTNTNAEGRNTTPIEGTDEKTSRTRIKPCSGSRLMG